MAAPSALPALSSLCIFPVYLVYPYGNPALISGWDLTQTSGTPDPIPGAAMSPCQLRPESGDSGFWDPSRPVLPRFYRSLGLWHSEPSANYPCTHSSSNPREIKPWKSGFKQGLSAVQPLGQSPSGAEVHLPPRAIQELARGCLISLMWTLKPWFNVNT